MIPKMTHPLSKHWNQPDTKNILIDDKHALMKKEDLEQLNEYSTSVPSGVYEGKCWKAKGLGDSWFLRWYGVSTDPDKCSLNTRLILIC